MTTTANYLRYATNAIKMLLAAIFFPIGFVMLAGAEIGMMLSGLSLIGSIFAGGKAAEAWMLSTWFYGTCAITAVAAAVGLVAIAMNPKDVIKYLRDKLYA